MQPRKEKKDRSGGPCSNLISGEQHIAVRSDDIGNLDGCAWELALASSRILHELERFLLQFKNEQVISLSSGGHA
jgi:hypothetical protein